MARPIHQYTIPTPGSPLAGYPATPPTDHPEGAPWPPVYTGDDPWDTQTPMFTTIGIVALTGDEEDACIQASQGNAQKLQKALVQRSLAQVDGRDVDRGRFEEREIWTRVTPMVRELWLSAYNRHNTAGRGLLDTFRRSYTITVA